MIETIIAWGNPDPEILLNFILALLLLGGVAAIIKSLVKKDSKKGEPAAPVHVKMEDHFVTRREFDNYSSNNNVNITKIEGVLLRVFDKMDERDEKLTEKLDKYSASSFEGRQRIHESMKGLRDRVVRTETLLEVKQKTEKEES